MPWPLNQYLSFIVKFLTEKSYCLVDPSDEKSTNVFSSSILKPKINDGVEWDEITSTTPIKRDEKTCNDYSYDRIMSRL